ncbi:putative uncharacterized protein DDB_G0286901 [Odontomachus brunneus]|uniref:putative uncharacterized protein DDB_G0286901 n=1 Tax=Odontomachus brunneus TaxID=486640 RepID=UPI0013F1F885|nr:putative uncharacterized protein DDB_G0286901 [Odontomachus brunneus]
MSVIESLLNFPLSHVSDNVCRFCQKTFCCTKCRDRHVDNVHPGLNVNCSLCASKTLPMKQFEFEKLLWENKKLLSHIIDKHLPLHCVLCENRIETSEDLRSIGVCKWYSEHRQILINERLPGTPATTSFDLKLKRSLSDNSHAFFTPPEIYRNTSTPMFISQKNSLEYQTPCAPNFTLKTPKTNSPLIAQSNATSKIQQSQNGDSDIKFFSFSPNMENMENVGMTPFRSNADDQFPRSNSGRKLNIKESNETVHGKAEEVTSNDDITHPLNMDLTMPFQSNADEQFPTSNSGRKLDIKESSETVSNEAEKSSYDNYTMSLIDMDLTNIEDNISQEHTPKLNVGSREESSRASDVVKKVRFSDQYETLSKFGNQVEFYVKNMTEEGDDVFHDAHDVSGVVKNTKSTESTQNTENTKDVNDTNDSKNTKITKDTKEKDSKEQDTEEMKNENMENIKDAKSNQVDDQKRCLVMSSKDSLDNTEINTCQENQQNAEKENRVVEALSNGVSIMTQKGTSRMLMMVLVENNSENLNNDLMPLIDSGLKKLGEQIISPSSDTCEFSNVNSTDYTRHSVTKVEMNISSVENYSNNSNNVEIMKDHQQIVSDFPSSSTENGQTSSNGGILSTVAQAVRLAFKNLSSVTSSVNSSQMVQQRQIVGDTMSLPETNISCNLDNNLEVRYGKRARDEVSSWVNPVPVSLDIKSPLPKRKRGWYKIKGRRPIRSVRNEATQVISPRGVSSETQFFSQGSLTVGDTVLPLPTRAHSKVSLASAE